MGEIPIPGKQAHVSAPALHILSQVAHAFI